MKFETIQPVHLDSGILIRDLLGLEASDLASAGTAGKGGGDPLRDLGAFMRRVIETSIQVSGVRELALHLHTDAGAEAAGWPSKKAADLATLLTWGLIQPRRRVKGLPFATLSAAADSIDPPVNADARLRALTARDLIAELGRKIGGDYDPSGEDVEDSFPSPVADILRPALGLDPATLHLYRTNYERPGSVDGKGRLGVERLVRDVLAQYEVMAARNTTVVRLMSVDDAQKDARIQDVRAAHIATLLAASLHGAAGHDVFFVEPRTRPARERAMLRQASKAVYLDYCDEALQGLELICDGFVHFGHGLERTIAERLLFEVASDCDPGLQRMPYCVQAQVGIELLLKAV